MSTWGIVLAAGRGERAQLGSNKVFFEINGRSVLSICLDAFARSGLLDGIVLVIAPGDQDSFDALCESEGKCDLVKKVVYGGSTRRESVYNGLKALPADAEIVAVHDAARPFVNADIISATIESARETGSGVISTPVVDTIKIVDGNGAVTTPPRSALRAVQTPQTFNCGMLIEAHERACRDDLPVTDDAMLFEHYYGKVSLVTANGAEENIKLTNKADFDALQEKNMLPVRIGQGYDAHRLKEGRKLILCGEEIPHTMGLDGHSDADVAVHALMDAILGALALGDIGRHFPDNDDRFKGISSMLLLENVMEKVREKGYRVGNADVTIIAQRPKLAAYMQKMKENVAAGLGVSPDCVNIKATTTERMGFEGQELGISSHAVALLVHV